MTSLAVRPVGSTEVDTLGELFGSTRTTRHCWCMSFCTSRAAFARGWFGGGNRRRFEAMVRDDRPMGVLACLAAVPVGWGACGPRSRYLGAIPSRHRLLGDRPRAEDETVWLLPCLFVHPEHRGEGISHALVDAAASLAGEHGASALEAWPSTGEASTDAFLGREGFFTELGFHCVARPMPGRAVMRLDLPEPTGSASR